jgi:hemoglobin/transferrin/lactoferrin receptor protein
LVQGVHPFPSFTFLPNPELVTGTAHDWEAGVNLKYDNVFRAGDSVRARVRCSPIWSITTSTSSKSANPFLASFVPGIPNSACPSLPPGLCMPLQPFQYINVAQARLSGVEL